MSSKKQKGQERVTPTPDHKSGKKPKPLIILLCVLVVAIGGWFLFKPIFSGTSDNTATPSADPSGESTASTATPEQLDKLVGRWLRRDGGYVLDIREVGAGGTLQAAYFNPNPIHVSQARVTGTPEGLHVFVELRDVGYPGATYRLTFDNQRDVLEGLYFQPAVGQTFDVEFVRIQ